MTAPARLAALCLVAAVFVAAAPARADEPVAETLSRAEVVARLVAANADVARAAAAVERARRERAGTRAVLDPVLDARLDLSHARTPTASGLSSGIATNDRYALTTGIGRTFAPGTHLSFTLSQAITRSEFPLRTGFDVLDETIVNGPDVDTQLTLEVSQPLLRGFGRDIVLLGELLADRVIDARELDALRAAESAALEAMIGYAELRYAEEELAVRERSLARTERQLDVAAAEVEAGQVAPIELDLVRERLAMRAETLVVAEAEVERRSRALARLLGEGPGSAATYRASDELMQPPSATFDEALCAEAVSASPEIAALGAQVAIAEGRATGTRDAIRPTLAATAGVTQSGLDSGWAESVGQAVTFDAPTLYGGVVFSTPLRNRGARSEHQVALADIDAAEFEVAEAGRSLCFEVRDAVATIQLQQERMALADSRVDIATRAIEAEEQRLQSGLSTVQAGLDSLQTLEEAEIARLRVATDAELGWWRLQFLRGRLLESLGGEVGAP